MHGIELRVQERRTFRFSAPQRLVSPTTGSMLQSPSRQKRILRLRSPVQSRSLVTAFPSPATVAPLGCPHFRVNVPGLLLRVPACLLPRPFGLFAPSPVSPRFAPGRATSSRQTRCASTSRLEQPLPRSPLPFGTLYIPSDQSVQPLLLPLSSPSEPARFPLAPRNRSISRVGYGSPFLVRYVSGG
jgi:hypothetical protein